MRIGVLFGGKSSEHEVSIRSARSVISTIDRNCHEVVPIAISKDGLFSKSSDFLEIEGGLPFIDACSALFKNLDVVIPMLHGPFGEDGTIQGVLEIAGIPYVGAGVLGSAIGLDKDVTKRLLRDAKIPIADFLVFTTKPSFEEVETKLGLPFFVKPATMGSSIGLTKVNSYADFDKSIELAFSFDHKIICEETIFGKEIECSVLGLEDPIASKPAEIIPKGSVYTYENKYLDKDGAKFILPARLSVKKTQELQEMAIKVFKILCCEGMARVDFFLDRYDNLYLNEINTIPGFTEISLYPKMWEISGISYRELIEQLILLAIKRARKKSVLSVGR